MNHGKRYSYVKKGCRCYECSEANAAHLKKNRNRTEGYRAYHRRYRKERARKFAAWKIERGCDRCGYSACAAALEFHHPDGTRDIDRKWSMAMYGWSSILRESEKCELLCSNCHREEHFGRGDD